MANQLLVLVEPGEDGSALRSQLEAPAAEAGLDLLLVAEAAAVAAVAARGDRNAAEVPLAAILIGPHAEGPVTLARQVHRAAPPLSILFLADGERAARVQRELSPVALVGRYRIVPTFAALLRQLRAIARSSSQRRQTRTTLDRINLSLENRHSALDGGEFRRLIISDRYLASLLKQAQDAILPLDDSGNIVLLNGAAEVLFGVPEREAAGRPLAVLSRENGASALAQLFDSTRASAAETRGEILHQHPDGSSVVLEVSIAPVRDEEGKRMGFLAIARDATERRQAEMERANLLEREKEARAAAEVASRAKDEFVSTLSHELRTPLNGMLGWAHLMRTGQLNAEQSARAIEAIERNARAQARLIDDLLDISRIVRGKLVLNLEPLELPSVIEAAVDSVRPAAEAKKIRLQLLLDSGIGPLLGDPQRLQQIVWNLMANAVRFTPKGGRIGVTLERINSHVEITVRDNGQGIDPEFLPFVFDRFRQADGSITRAHGGLGLGLSIVRHLAELHGGTVRVESGGEGQGAAFTVKLPMTAIRPAPAEAERVHATARSTPRFEPSQKLAGLRLLVVDDEPDTVELLVFLLTSCGADVQSASSAAEALQALASWPADLLISDVGMPAEDGYSLLRKMREKDGERNRWTPAIALTAYARPEDRVRLLSAGFQAHLPKPVDPSELIAVILSQTHSPR